MDPICDKCGESFLKVHVFGVHANNAIVIFMMEFVGFVILTRMIKDLSTILQTFPITIQHHHHLRLIAIIVETLPNKEYRVGNVFVMNVDTPIVCAMPRVLTRLTLAIRALIFILKIFMNKIRITMVIHFKIH